MTKTSAEVEQLAIQLWIEWIGYQDGIENRISGA